MAKYLTNGDKILQAVLADERLISSFDYNPADYDTISSALASDNTIVCAVAKIIEGRENKSSDREIYNDVTNFLKTNLL